MLTDINLAKGQKGRTNGITAALWIHLEKIL